MSDSSPMKVKFYNRLNFKITLGIVVTLVVVLGVSSYLLYSYQRSQWIDSLKDSTTNLSALVNNVLQSAMLDNHPDLIRAIIRNSGEEQSLKDIMIFDKKGTIKFASKPEMVGSSVSKDSTTCLICHRFEPEDRASTVIYTTSAGEKVFRNVNPIFNAPECHRCHEASDKLNGVLIMDFSMAGVNRALVDNMKRVLTWTLLVIGIISVVLWFLLNRIVMRRLFVFLRHTERVGRGELEAAVEGTGKDEMATLADNFNRMTEDLKEYIKVKEIKLQKEQLERLVDSIDEGVLVVDEEDRVVVANQAVARLLDRRGDELVGEYCCTLFDKEANTREQCLVRKTFRTGRLNKAIRSFRDNHGKEHELEFYAAPILDASGNVYQVVEVLRDITERKKLEAELIHAERLASLGILASGISHEIRTPLASITTCIEGLQRMLAKTSSMLNPEELGKFDKYLALSKKEAERCKVISEKLLFLSRKSIPATTRVDVNNCLEETISLLQFEARRCDIKVEKDFDPQLPVLNTDESDLREIFFNVILNAIQAMEDGGGCLALSTSLTDERIEITISDTGVGIPPEDLVKIFEPFFTRKPLGKGTGLGLSLCENMIKQMGGNITVISSPGHGARFELWLPLN